jgi:biotin carboxyl carrier protein
MRGDNDLRSLLQTLGSAALGVGLGLAVLGAGFFISRTTLAANTVVVSTSSGSPSPTRSPSPTPRPTATPAPVVTPAPTAAPTTPPAPTSDPLVVTAYSGQGLRLAALTIPAGYTVTSPIAGRVTITLYQFVDGEVRTGVSDQPSYPYVFVRSADREIKLRPGAIDKDVQLLVKDGDTVAVGAPLFKTLTTGASSWALFYDKAVTAQVIASVTAQPSGNELDPVPVFKK